MTRVVDVVVVRSDTVEGQLQQMQFRRTHLKLRIAASPGEIPALVADQRPDVLVIDAGTAPESAFSVCRRLKGGRDTRNLPVVMVISGKIDPLVRHEMIACEADRLLVGNLKRETLYRAIEPFIANWTREHPRVRMAGQAQVQIGERELPAEIVDLSVGGVRVRLAAVIDADSEVTVRLFPGASEPIEIEGRIVWVSKDSAQHDVAFQFSSLTPETRGALERMTTWQLVDEGTPRRVKVMSELSERSNWSGLVERLEGRVEFDLSKVTTINSQGIIKWIEFLDALPDRLEYSLASCSSVFFSQATHLRDMLGRATVHSIFAPYHCDECDNDIEREIVVDTAEQFDPDASIPCPECSEPMYIDYDPNRLLSLLRPSSDE